MRKIALLIILLVVTTIGVLLFWLIVGDGDLGMVEPYFGRVENSMLRVRGSSSI